MTSSWYAIRTAPGAQRMAKAIPLAENQQHRKGESVIERDCRRKKIELYMPSFWLTSKHQRTNKMLEKRFPLLVGYAFVNLRDGDFFRVASIESILGFIRGGNAGMPFAFRDEDIGALMLAEMEHKKAYEVDRDEKDKLNRQQRRQQLNRALGLVFPKGRRKKVPLRMLAEAEIESLSTQSRKRVREILEGLQALDNEDMACKTNQSRLDSAA